MLAFRYLFSFISFIPLVLGLPSSLSKRGVSQDVLDDLVLYTKYSSAAELITGSCPKPLNSTLVEQFTNEATQTQGFITRDDARKEIIVAFAGSEQLEDALTDIDIPLVQFSSQGVSDDLTDGVLAHQGFLDAFNSVASGILDTVTSQLKQNPSYSLVSTGHSLGGALASVAGVSLAANFPDVPLRMFTFGQPRTGSPEYAALVEKLVGAENIFRAVHTFDGVPTLIPQIIGYRHHATEYWNFQDPGKPLIKLVDVSTDSSVGAADNVKVCDGEEDPTCSDSIPSTGINAAHLVYFGQAMALDPSLCGL